MKKYACPTCKKPLSKAEFEKALKIQGEKEKHFHELEQKYRNKEERFKEKEKSLRKQAVEAKNEGRLQEKRRADRLADSLRGKTKHIGQLKDYIKQLKRGTTPQTEGLEYEKKLIACLRKRFPSDKLQHEGKAGDILQFVMFEGKEAGIIVFECKKTEKLLGEHIKQTFSAKQSRRAHFAVLVTNARNKTFNGFVETDGILIASSLPSVVISLVSLLREHLIEMLRADLGKEKRMAIAKKLITHITSPTFQNPIGEITQTASELQGLLKKEAKDHLKTWQKRWNLYQIVKWDSFQIKNNLQLVLHGKKPRTDLRPKSNLPQLPSLS